MLFSVSLLIKHTPLIVRADTVRERKAKLPTKNNNVFIKSVVLKILVKRWFECHCLYKMPE